MTRDTKLDLAHLPTSMRQLVECIGLNAASALVDAYGGTRLWIPEHFQTDHHLVETIGVTAAKALVARYALEHLLIPRCSAALRAARDQALRTRYHRGETARTLAREFNLTETRVYQIVAVNPPRDSTQQRLF